MEKIITYPFVEISSNCNRDLKNSGLNSIEIKIFITWKSDVEAPQSLATQATSPLWLHSHWRMSHVLVFQDRILTFPHPKIQGGRRGWKSQGHKSQFSLKEISGNFHVIVPLTSHWSELGPLATSSCKEGWKIESLFPAVMRSDKLWTF